jgi:hypothetical protein
MKWRFRNGSAFVAALLFVTLAAGSVLAVSSTWKLYSFNSSGRALRSQTVAAASNGSASFTFPVAPNAAYLLSTKAPSSGALSASVSIADTGAGTTFAYYPNGTPAMVGLYFETKSSGGFNPSDYWWSGSSRVSLNSIVTSGPTAVAAAPTLISSRLVTRLCGPTSTASPALRSRHMSSMASPTLRPRTASPQLWRTSAAGASPSVAAASSPTAWAPRPEAPSSPSHRRDGGLGPPSR